MHRLKKKKKNDEKNTKSSIFTKSYTAHDWQRQSTVDRSRIQRLGAEFSYKNTSVTERTVKTFQIATIAQRNSHKNCTQSEVSLKNEEDDVAQARTVFW